MCEKSCGLSFDSPLLWRKNALLFWRKSRVCFSLVAPGVFPHACRCAGADTRSCIAHSVSLKFLPSPFTFTDNKLIYSWLWVKSERFLVLHRWRKLRWNLHPQSVVHQLIILYGWRGEGKKRKTPDARVCACALGGEVDVFENGERPQCLIDCEVAVNRFLSVFCYCCPLKNACEEQKEANFRWGKMNQPV